MYNKFIYVRMTAFMWLWV